MNDSEQNPDSELVHIPWYRQSLLHLVIISLVVSFFMVLLAMALYASSGAEQLDISRPGYKSVQNQVDQTDSFVSFSADGPVNAAVIDEFLKLYDKQTSRVDSSDVFSSRALSAAALEIDAPSTKN